MIRKQWKHICASLAVAASLAPGTAWSIPAFQTNVFNQLADGGGVTEEFSFNNPVANFNNSIGTEISGAQAQAGSSIKSVKARSSVSGASSTFFSAFSLISSSYSDTFVMNAIGLDGSPVSSGVFTATAVLTGTAEASGGGVYSSLARIAASVSVNGFSDGDIQRATSSGLGENSPRTIAHGVFITIPWASGQPITMTMSAVAETSGFSGPTVGSAPGFFSASADIFSTVEWTGIIDVLDGSGNPVAAFTALNDAGLDYATGLAAAATIVPEPGALGLFGLGLAAFGWGARRRSASNLAHSTQAPARLPRGNGRKRCSSR